MVFPLLLGLEVAAVVGVGGGLIYAGKEAGEQVGKKSGSLLIIAAIALVAMLIMKKKGLF